MATHAVQIKLGQRDIRLPHLWGDYSALIVHYHTRRLLEATLYPFCSNQWLRSTLWTDEPHESKAFDRFLS